VHFRQNPIQSLEGTSLCLLKERDDLRNILILDYKSLIRGKQLHRLKDILSCKCLEKYFYIVFLCESCQESDVNQMLPDQKKFLVVESPSKVLQKDDCISDHIVTQIIKFVEQYRCRRAFYCLSLDVYFPEGFKIMEYTCREFTYCATLRSVEDLMHLDANYFRESDDPATMNVLPLLTNHVPRKSPTEKSGKLMFFCHGVKYFGNTIESVWKELKHFGDKHSLHVSVTTDFPILGFEVSTCTQYHVLCCMYELYDTFMCIWQYGIAKITRNT